MNLIDCPRLKFMGVRVFGSRRKEPLPKGSLRNLFGAGNTSQIPGAIFTPRIFSSVEVI